jgi:hypothetical protein
MGDAVMSPAKAGYLQIPHSIWGGVGTRERESGVGVPNHVRKVGYHVGRDIQRQRTPKNARSFSTDPDQLHIPSFLI